MSERNISLEQVFRDKTNKDSKQGFSALSKLLFRVEFDERLFSMAKGAPSKPVHVVLQNLDKEVSNEIEDKLMSLLGKLR